MVKVPSENELCEGLGVSRSSVREAMKILAALGVVEMLPQTNLWHKSGLGRFPSW